MRLITLSWKNIIHRPLSLILTLVLFALGVGLIAFLFVVNRQIEDKFEKNLAGIDLVLGAKGSPLQLVLCNMYHIDAPTGNIPLQSVRAFFNPDHPLIGDVTPLSIGDSYRGFRIVGTTRSFVDLYELDLTEGSWWENDFDATIGPEVAKRLDLKIGDSFQSTHGLLQDDNLTHEESHAFRVTGILATSGTVADQLILTNTQSIWSVHDHESGVEGHPDHPEVTTGMDATPHFLNAALLEHPDESITSLLIRFKARNYQALNMARNINENTDLQAATPAIEINRLFALMGVGMDALRTLGWLIAIVSGLSIFISLYGSLKDRKYELALMRVQGASPGKLFSMIILEGLLLALAGYFLGLLLAHMSMFVLTDYLEAAYKYPFNPFQWVKEEGWLAIGALGIGLIAALLPAWQAYRTELSTTLAEN
ncbi:MAG: FtsX-like permease family protein [Saprospiraceae bacterium]